MGRPVDVEKDYCAIARRYAVDVTSGKIPSSRWVKAACQRQLDDLARKGWKWKFDKRKANRFCRFMELLPHIKGRWKTKTIELQPHQCFRFTTIFGWVERTPEQFRRFRKALIVLPRKNGKTTEAAGVGIYMLALDGEPGSEVYAAAVTKDQVTGPSGVWTVANKMVKASPGLQDRYGVDALAHSIVIESKGASFKPLARDANPNEGLNIHCAILDELHAHKTREIFDVIDDGTGARKQPLLYIISTEGDNPTGVFAEQRAYLEQILSGTHEDDSYFGIIYTIDKDDDWTTPESWYKANPNLGISVYEDDLRIRCRQAQKNPASQSSFLTKRLNVRVGAGEAYYNMLAWEHKCKDVTLRLEDFYGQPCQIFLDLASESDIAAKVMLFRQGDRYYVFGKWYLPEDSAERGNPNYDVYRGWADSDLIVLTPGGATDYEFIERDLLEDAQNFQVQTPACDPCQATYLANRLQNQGIELVKYNANFANFSEPMKHLGGLILSGKIKHNGDPVLTWMMGNVTPKRDAGDRVYPRKTRNENKIDGAVALIGALGMLHRMQPVALPGVVAISFGD
jgi:phage terminase large subunit-like protein